MGMRVGAAALPLHWPLEKPRALFDKPVFPAPRESRSSSLVISGIREKTNPKPHPSERPEPAGSTSNSAEAASLGLSAAAHKSSSLRRAACSSAAVSLTNHSEPVALPPLPGTALPSLRILTQDLYLGKLLLTDPLPLRLAREKRWGEPCPGFAPPRTPINFTPWKPCGAGLPTPRADRSRLALHLLPFHTASKDHLGTCLLLSSRFTSQCEQLGPACP